MLVLGFASVLAAAGVNAAVTDDFESYAVGSNIHGQGGWKGWDNTASAGATISDAFAASGTKSVNITGGSDLVREFVGVTSGVWSLTVKQFIPSTSSGTSYFILMNKYKDLGAAADYNWSAQIQHNMASGYLTNDLTGVSAALVKNAWVDYRFDIDLDQGRVSEYYNNQLLGTRLWQDGGVNALAAIDLYANNAGPIYYDNFSLTQVPEPTTAALLGLGLAAFLFRRRVS